MISLLLASEFRSVNMMSGWFVKTVTCNLSVQIIFIYERVINHYDELIPDVPESGIHNMILVISGRSV